MAEDADRPAQTVQEADASPEEPEVDPEMTLRERRRGVCLRYGLGMAAWATGAVLITVVHLFEVFGGPLAGTAPYVSNPLLLAATGTGVVGAALFGLAGLHEWDGKIQRIESRIDRYEARQRYRRVRTGLVVLFGFIGGMWLWTFNDAAVPLIAVGAGFPLMVLALHHLWADIPSTGRRLAIFGTVLVALHPLLNVFLYDVTPALTAPGYAFMAVPVLMAYDALSEPAEGTDVEGDPDPAAHS